jgi:hypothetical protein
MVHDMFYVAFLSEVLTEGRDRRPVFDAGNVVGACG